MMRNLIGFGIIFVLILGASILVIIFLKPKEYLSIQNDNVCFGMSEKDLKKIKGESIEINENIGDTPFDEYVFNEQLFGYQAKASYSFYKSLFGLKLQSACIIIGELDFNSAKKLHESILDTLVKNYSNKKGYYNNGLQSDGSSYLDFSLGVNHGATGITYNANYKNNTLIVSIIKQV